MENKDLLINSANSLITQVVDNLFGKDNNFRCVVESRAEANKIKKLIPLIDNRMQAYITNTSIQKKEKVDTFKEMVDDTTSPKMVYNGKKLRTIHRDGYAVYAEFRYDLKETIEELKKIYK